VHPYCSAYSRLSLPPSVGP